MGERVASWVPKGVEMERSNGAKHLIDRQVLTEPSSRVNGQVRSSLFGDAYRLCWIRNRAEPFLRRRPLGGQLVRRYFPVIRWRNST